jgi:hypothetical protein
MVTNLHDAETRLRGPELSPSNGDCDGNSYLLDDGHAENGSTAGRPGRQSGR